VARAKELHSQLVADLDHEEGASPGFEMQADPESGPGVLWIYSDDCGDPDHVIRFVLLCAEAFDLQGVWAFTWALCRYRHNAHYAGVPIMPLPAPRVSEPKDLRLVDSA
jgi:hypothetical protein